VRSENLHLHGIDAPLDEEIHLKAGPFELVFEPARAYMRRVRLNGVDVVRNTYLHARGADWSTVLPTVTMKSVKTSASGFELEWTATHIQGEIDFAWTGRLTGSPSSVTYHCDCEARRRFATNRTGICVLIPMEYAGTDAMVGHSDGSTELVHLDERVVPVEPLRTMHTVQFGGAKLTFEGDSFEAEDQRNWTDSSYKAYALRGRRAGPYTLEAGEKFVHSVTIQPFGPALPLARPVLGGILPRIGARLDDDASDLSGLRADYLRVTGAAGEIGQRRLEHAREARRPIRLVGAEAGSDLEARIASGHRIGAWRQVGFFDGFNLKQPELEGMIGVEFDATPQIHTFDERSILDNARTLEPVVKTARALAAGRPVSVNLHLSGSGPDPRFPSLFGALWLLASVAAAGRGGAESITPGTAKELRSAPISALLQEIGGGRPFEAGLDENTDEIVSVRLGEVLLIGNLLRQSREVNVKGAQNLRLLRFDGWHAAEAVDALTLSPYEIVRVGF
jgi:hypothetical protein